jgi:hypothetical protein
VNGISERRLNLGIVGTTSCKKYTAKPVQFGRPPAFLCSCDQCFRFRYSLESFGHAIRKMQSFSL